MNWRHRILNTLTPGARNQGYRRRPLAHKNAGRRSLRLEPLENRLLLIATALDTSQLVNISDLGKATVDYSGMIYNRRTDEVSLDASVINSSSDTMPASLLYLVVDSGVPVGAQFANADGQTVDGKPYYVLQSRSDDATAEFSAGEALEREKLVLANAGRARIDLST